MADYEKAYKIMLKHEGGYVNDPDDRGGETYKGVARKFNSKWEGWSRIDEHKSAPDFPKSLDSDQTLENMIKGFYESLYWDKIKGDEIQSQLVAESMFDYGVNAGPSTCSRLVQKLLEVKVDGAIGPKTLEALNGMDEDHFLASFSLMKIVRYVQLVEKYQKNRKFFFGWVKRTLGGA